MIHVFCGRKGSGKTKALIKLANEKVDEVKGNIVYIDDDTKAVLQLSSKMRFVATNEFNLKSNNDFYGFCAVCFQKITILIPFLLMVYLILLMINLSIRHNCFLKWTL